MMIMMMIMIMMMTMMISIIIVSSTIIIFCLDPLIFFISQFQIPFEMPNTVEST